MVQKILESILELVILESEINEQIEFNIEELERLSELMETKRYIESDAILKIHNRIFKETLELIEEKRIIQEIKDMLGIEE